jgi:imidazolonepropionase-like amidohydrolase
VLGAPEGHCWYLGGEVDPIPGEHALRAAVRERIERGCDVVKVMVTGGFLTPTHPMWSPQFSLDDLRVMVRLQEPGRATRRGLHELGATLVPGTDAGIGPAKPHDVMTYALAEFVACGLTPRRSLQAMTADAAAACGVGNSKGRIAVGFEADVVAFAGHPADELDAIHAPVAVWTRGVRAR